MNEALRASFRPHLEPDAGRIEAAALWMELAMRIHRYDPITAAARWRRRLNAHDPYALAIARACEEWKREQARARRVKPMYLNFGKPPPEQDEW